MVEAITAFKTTRGQIFKTEGEALSAEMKERLHFIFTNENYQATIVNAVLNHQSALLELLQTDVATAYYKYQTEGKKK